MFEYFFFRKKKETTGKPAVNAEACCDSAVEFQPDAIEIKNERLPRWMRHAVPFALIFFIALLFWACVGKVDVIVQARGKLVSGHPNIVMKPLERIVIKEINVKLGDVVRPGQVLITFDPTGSVADVERLRGELTALRAQYNRLRAEFDGGEYQASGAGKYPTIQSSIFRQRKVYYREKLHSYDESLRQLDATRRTKIDSLKKQRESLVAVKRIEDMFKQLHASKAASLKELLQISITRIDTEAGVDQLYNNLQELAHQRESQAAGRESFIQEWKQSIGTELVSTQREMTSMEQQLAKAENLVSYVCLRSPCAAVVHDIAAFSKGSAVREAEALVTLIPLGGHVELEAEIEPRDIGKISKNSEVRIKLDAYPFQKHGTLNGRIRNISEDTISRERGSGGDGAATYYRARIAVSGTLRTVHAGFRLIPGMEAQAEIKAGRRRVIEYVLYPLIKALDEAMREP